jgi:hypothetical protein
LHSATSTLFSLPPSDGKIENFHGFLPRFQREIKGALQNTTLWEADLFAPPVWDGGGTYGKAESIRPKV